MAAVLLWSAAALGILFLALKGIEYHSEYDERLIPGIDFDFSRPYAGPISLFFAFYFVATGLHAVHVTVGVVVLIVIGIRASQQAYSERYHAPITAAALYWHFVDMVWIFLFALIYLPGRSG